MKPARKKTEKAVIDLNPEFQLALDVMEKTDRHVFVTGRAGTGKSTLLQYFRGMTKKKIVVLAPTGVAAVNVGGQTIHSFFGFKPDVTLAAIRKKAKSDKTNLYRKLTAIVIDEVSMVRADLMDCVDAFLRLNGPDAKRPFGGVQMIFIGDLYQLPPVVAGDAKDIFRVRYASPYFFSAKVFEDLAMDFVELEKVYRQSDTDFIRLLNCIRNRTAAPEDLAILNQRADQTLQRDVKDFHIHLTSTNALADGINKERLAQLKGKMWTAHGFVDGEFGKEYLPTDEVLKLKKGAQIMLLNNDAAERWINGTVGKITGFSENEDGEGVIAARLDTGGKVQIEPYRWEIYKYFLKDNELESEVVGSFRQYPVRLAFAVTIHKSQGKTFDKAVIDVGKGTFAHGQMYVALSRCRSLEGIILKQPIKQSHIIMDWRVVKFLTGIQYETSARILPRDEKIRIIREAIAGKKTLEIVYLKGKDEKSRRSVRPLVIGEMEYNGRPYLGMIGMCLLRRDRRVFNVDRILEISSGQGSVLHS